MEIKNIPTEEIKDLICKIPSVMYCSLVYDKNSRIQEIHVVATVERNVKQLVRDIQSAIQARFEIEVDYKIISIAQINEVDYKEARLLIEEIDVKNVGNTIEATVTLTFEDKKFAGTSTKVKTQGNKYKAIAEATVLAMESYLGIRMGLYLDSIERINIGGKSVCVSLVGLAYNNNEESLVGCSIINTDENESIVKSVLAAVNRRVSSIG